MERQSDEEALERVCSSGRKVAAEAVAADIFHALLIWERWDGRRWIVAHELLI